jgi:para-nitrobenzyl esterase
MPEWAGAWLIEQTESEACQVLNVWTPGLDDRRRPVMVWLHGGGFAQGSGSSPLYDGRRLAERGDVVVVTLNHRLSIFGYLHLGLLGGDRYAACENLGQQDIVAALEWVRDNIAAFGGDPACVTVFGESGGGGKVCTLMAMPAAEGLFHRAIVQSGPLAKVMMRDQAVGVAERTLAALGLTLGRLDEIESVPPAALLDAIPAASAGWSLAFSPIAGGATLPRHPFDPDAPELSAAVPLLIGWNKDEVTTLTPVDSLSALGWDALPAALAPFLGGAAAEPLIQLVRDQRPAVSAGDVFFEIASDRMFGQGSRHVAALKATRGRAPAFFYKLTWPSPAFGGKYRCGHSLDLPLVFDNVAGSTHFVGEGAEPQALAEVMSQAWLNFARHGDPNGPGVPSWSPFEPQGRPTMVFDVASGEIGDPDGALARAIDGLPAFAY